METTQQPSPSHTIILQEFQIPPNHQTNNERNEENGLIFREEGFANDGGGVDEMNEVGGEGEGEGREVTTRQQFSLPEVDGGRDAWLFLASAFVVEALVWGLPFSFGVFQEYYRTHEPFASSPSIAIIGTTTTGILYLGGLLLFPAYKQWPRLATTSKWLGIPLMATGLLAASFAQTVNQLVLTQGALYAVGGCVVYNPMLLFIDEWFIRRKGLAYGIMWAGTGAAGLIVPFILNHLLTHYTFRTTLRIWAITLIITSQPLVYFLRPRIPALSSSSSSNITISGPRNYGLKFLTTSTFWFFQIGLVVESLGYFIPSIYLPTYASSLGLSPQIGTLLVALINGSGVLSTILMGMLVDRFHVTTVVLLSTIGATISVLLFWGLSTALPLLCVFSLLYGFFAGGFVSTNAGVIRLVKQRDESADVGTLIGFIGAARGVGALISGPLSEALVGAGGWKAEGAYGTEYGELIVFTGVTAAAGGISFLGRRLGWV